MATMKTLNGYGFNATEFNGKTSDSYLQLGGDETMDYKKPQSTIVHGGAGIYPLTTADQVILADGSRLEKNGKISVDSAADSAKLGGKLPAEYASAAVAAAHEVSIGDAWVSGKTYAVGDYCISDNKLYKCKTAHTAGSTFNSDYWDAVSLAREMQKLNAEETYTENGYTFIRSGKIVTVSYNKNNIYITNEAVVATLPKSFRPPEQTEIEATNSARTELVLSLLLIPSGDVKTLCVSGTKETVRIHKQYYVKD